MNLLLRLLRRALFLPVRESLEKDRIIAEKSRITEQLLVRNVEARHEMRRTADGLRELLTETLGRST